MRKEQLIFKNFRKIKSGDYRASFDLSKEMKSLLYDQALKDNKITLKDLVYQSTRLNIKVLKNLIVSAELRRLLMEITETKEGTERKGQKTI